jgi:hypothetical protein
MATFGFSYLDGLAHEKANQAHQQGSNDGLPGSPSLAGLNYSMG